jgi:endonuclease YncB( thermonuclease family)
MNFKTFLNGIVLFIGLGLAAYSQFNKNTQPPSSYQPPKLPPKQEQKFEIWQLKSIHDGDTLRVFKGSEELKIRLCGIDSPEIKQSLGIEARDHLRSLVDIGNDELLLVPVEKDIL